MLAVAHIDDTRLVRTAWQGGQTSPTWRRVSGTADAVNDALERAVTHGPRSLTASAARQTISQAVAGNDESRATGSMPFGQSTLAGHESNFSCPVSPTHPSDFSSNLAECATDAWLLFLPTAFFGTIGGT
jgi:hypothetical protein